VLTFEFINYRSKSLENSNFQKPPAAATPDEGIGMDSYPDAKQEKAAFDELLQKATNNNFESEDLEKFDADLEPNKPNEPSFDPDEPFLTEIVDSDDPVIMGIAATNKILPMKKFGDVKPGSVNNSVDIIKYDESLDVPDPEKSVLPIVGGVHGKSLIINSVHATNNEEKPDAADHGHEKIYIDSGDHRNFVIGGQFDGSPLIERFSPLGSLPIEDLPSPVSPTPEPVVVKPHSPKIPEKPHQDFPILGDEKDDEKIVCDIIQMGGEEIFKCRIISHDTIKEPAGVVVSPVEEKLAEVPHEPVAADEHHLGKNFVPEKRDEHSDLLSDESKNPEQVFDDHHHFEEHEVPVKPVADVDEIHHDLKPSEIHPKPDFDNQHDFAKMEDPNPHQPVSHDDWFPEPSVVHPEPVAADEHHLEKNLVPEKRDEHSDLLSDESKNPEQVFDDHRHFEEHEVPVKPVANVNEIHHDLKPSEIHPEPDFDNQHDFAKMEDPNPHQPVSHDDWFPEPSVVHPEPVFTDHHHAEKIEVAEKHEPQPSLPETVLESKSHEVFQESTHIESHHHHETREEPKPEPENEISTHVHEELHKPDIVHHVEKIQPQVSSLEKHNELVEVKFSLESEPPSQVLVDEEPIPKPAELSRPIPAKVAAETSSKEEPECVVKHVQPDHFDVQPTIEVQPVSTKSHVVEPEVTPVEPFVKKPDIAEPVFVEQVQEKPVAEPVKVAPKEEKVQPAKISPKETKPSAPSLSKTTPTKEKPVASKPQLEKKVADQKKPVADQTPKPKPAEKSATTPKPMKPVAQKSPVPPSGPLKVHAQPKPAEKPKTQISSSKTTTPLEPKPQNRRTQSHSPARPEVTPAQPSAQVGLIIFMINLSMFSF